ncbi:hypothetical protein [Frankia sp. Cr2]|uniref:hypothetical protein n=1 Tax=Frankia sp. Cr2 TaxID=3073932 RepID=UPI002AD56438|nr:hypothetical protein [Frankia sp. Cr2]
MAAGRWVVGVLIVLAGLAAVAAGIVGVAVAVHAQAAAVTEAGVDDARVTKGVLLVVGGLFGSVAGGQVCRSARHRGRLSRRGRVLFTGGYLLVAAGLAVVARHNSVGGFSVGFGLQALGAIAVGTGGNAVRRDSGPPSSHELSGH